jgi:hypothetical protein
MLLATGVEDEPSQKQMTKALFVQGKGQRELTCKRNYSGGRAGEDQNPCQEWTSNVSCDPRSLVTKDTYQLQFNSNGMHMRQSGLPTKIRKGGLNSRRLEIINPAVISTFAVVS